MLEHIGLRVVELLVSIGTAVLLTGSPGSALKVGDF